MITFGPRYNPTQRPKAERF